MSDLPDKIDIWEVGPRDGLQNEPAEIFPGKRADFVRDLAKAGLDKIEAGAFVSPKAVPQMAGSGELAAELEDLLGSDTVQLSALVPNREGMERAVDAGFAEVAVFTAASDEFNRQNINTDIDGSFERFQPVFELAEERDIRVRGYVSTVVECPYSGKVAPEKAAEVAERLVRNGCYQVSLGETLGVAVPEEIAAVVDAALVRLHDDQVALHLHDTFGTGLANVAAGLERGVTTFDASAGGLGGCPYAPGAGGNLATEDLVYFAERRGIDTGVDPEKLADATAAIHQHLDHPPRSKAWHATMGKRQG